MPHQIHKFVDFPHFYGTMGVVRNSPGLATAACQKAGNAVLGQQLHTALRLFLNDRIHAANIMYAGMKSSEVKGRIVKE